MLIDKKIMDGLQFVVFVLTAVYLCYSIRNAHDQRKKDSAALAS